MTPTQYIDSLPEDRKEVISRMRELILKSDPLVREVVAGVMGRDALVFLQGDIMKYSLSSAKQYMSFYTMVMYASKGMAEKFSKLLPKAKFQKGCINFKTAMHMPLDIAEKFIEEMSAIEYPPPQYKERMEKNAAKMKAAREKAMKD